MSDEHSLLHTRINNWYAAAGRDLPWREPDCTPWGVFVSEVMAQQTPLARVLPYWTEWLQRWPTPTALAASSPADVIAAWGRLGYPRRALRLREAAQAMVDRFDGRVPDNEANLLTLPGVGSYTAAAVACFAYGQPTVVIDTNVRRVLARSILGDALPSPTLTAAEQRLAATAQPAERDAAVVWNVAAMELGALICTARAPRCAECPVLDLCAWQRAGAPAYEGPARRGQAWSGTDRQVRGEIVQRLRERSPRPLAELESAAAEQNQLMRCLDSLVADGLVEPLARQRFRLPH